MNNLKTGTNVIFTSLSYLFLGYSDYKRKYAIIADKHGNKIEVFSNQLS